MQKESTIRRVKLLDSAPVSGKTATWFAEKSEPLSVPLGSYNGSEVLISDGVSAPFRDSKLVAQLP